MLTTSGAMCVCVCVCVAIGNYARPRCPTERPIRWNVLIIQQRITATGPGVLVHTSRNCSGNWARVLFAWTGHLLGDVIVRCLFAFFGVPFFVCLRGCLRHCNVC